MSMTTDEIRDRLLKAMALRMPQFNPGDNPRKKMEELEQHILVCAWHRAELEEALHWCIEAGKLLKRQWEGHTGYEVALRSGGRPTVDQINAAKRATGMQEVWDGMQEAGTLKESLHRQISRLGGSDYDAASRAYTLMAGG